MNRAVMAASAARSGSSHRHAHLKAMGVRKLSVALDDGVAQAAAASAERQGLSLSAWLNRAAERALAIEDGLAAVAEWEAEHGPLPAEELAAADAVLAAARKTSV